MDFIIDLPLNQDDGSTVLLVITNRLGKGTMLLRVLPGHFNAEGIVQLLLDRCIGIHWLPNSIVSDRGT